MLAYGDIAAFGAIAPPAGDASNGARDPYDDPPGIEDPPIGALDPYDDPPGIDEFIGTPDGDPPYGELPYGDPPYDDPVDDPAGIAVDDAPATPADCGSPGMPAGNDPCDGPASPGEPGIPPANADGVGDPGTGTTDEPANIWFASCEIAIAIAPGSNGIGNAPCGDDVAPCGVRPGRACTIAFGPGVGETSVGTPAAGSTNWPIGPRSSWGGPSFVMVARAAYFELGFAGG